MDFKTLTVLSILYGTVTCASFQSFQKNVAFSGTVSFLNALNFGEVQHSMVCARHCTSASNCDGYFYSETKKDCYGYNAAASDNSFFDAGYESFGKGDVSLPGPTVAPSIAVMLVHSAMSSQSSASRPLGTTTTAVIGSTNLPGYKAACTVNSDCTVPNTICWSNECECEPGLVLDTAAGNCAISCAVYGSTYIKYDGYSFSLPTNRTAFGTTEQQCLQNCTADPLCRSLNLFNDMCIMKYYTVYGYPSNFVSISSMDYYVRNCA